MNCQRRRAPGIHRRIQTGNARPVVARFDAERHIVIDRASGHEDARVDVGVVDPLLHVVGDFGGGADGARAEAADPPQRAMSRTVHSPPSGSACWKAATAEWIAFESTSADRVIKLYWERSTPIQPEKRVSAASSSGVALELVVLGPGLLLGLVDDRRHQRVDAGVVGVAADLDHCAGGCRRRPL